VRCEGAISGFASVEIPWGGATLLAPAASPLMTAARTAGLDVRPFTLASLVALSRQYDLVHAHDARSHTWAVTLGNAPVVVSRRVAFAVKGSLCRNGNTARASLLGCVSFVKQTLLDASIPAIEFCCYDGVELPALWAGRDDLGSGLL